MNYTLLKSILVLPVLLATCLASDSFSSAPLVAANSIITGDNSAATTEGGEPSHVGYKTMWYRYTAPSRGVVRITTPDDSANFSHKVHVFRGTSLSTLNLVEWGYEYSARQVNFSFPVEAGMTFYIAFASAFSTTDGGPFQIAIQQSAWPYGSASTPLSAPSMPTTSLAPNNDIESAQIIQSIPDPLIVLGYNYSASQSNLGPEPRTAGYRTLWYEWKAAKRGVAVISSPASPVIGFRHVLRVYRGSTITALTHVAGFSTNHDEGGSTSFPVEAGMTYRISFGSTNDDDAGPVLFTIRTDSWPYGNFRVVTSRAPVAEVPANNLFEGATKIPSKPGKYTILDYNTSATTASSTIEPSMVRYKSLWYSWRAKKTGYVAISTQSSPPWDAAYSISAWQGGSYDNLKFINGEAASDDSIRFGFKAIKGKTYYLSVANYFEDSLNRTCVFRFESGPKVEPKGVKSRITFPSKSQVVSRSGFTIGAKFRSPKEEVLNIECKVNGKVVYKGFIDDVPTNGIFSGRVKKGKTKITIRAQDALLKWGKTTTRYVVAK